MKRILFFLSFFCIVLSLSAVKPDSLLSVLKNTEGKEKVDILIKLSIFYRTNDTELSLKYAEQALELGTKLKYDFGIAKSYFRIGYTNFILRNFKVAIENFERAKKYYDKSHQINKVALSLEFLANCSLRLDEFIQAKNYMDKAIINYQKIDSQKDIARVYSNSSQVLTRLGNLDQALQNLYKALEIKQELADPINEQDQLGIANTFTNIGITLLKTKDFERALEYLFKSKEIKELYCVIDESIYSNIGIAYNEMQQYEKSLEYHQRALEIGRAENNLNAISQELNNIGYVYDLQKDWNTCLQYYLKSYQMKKQLNDLYGIANSAKNVGSIYLEINNLSKAENYLDESMKIADNNKMVEIIRDNHYLYSRLFEKQKNYKLALQNERKYSALQDSIFTQSMKDKIAEMEAKNNLYEHQRENEILQRDNEILMLKSEKDKLAKLRSYLTFLISLLIVIYFVDLTLRNQSKRKKMAAIKDELEAKVRSRTQELERINVDLQQQIEIRKKTEEMLKDSLDEKLVMLREIHHRVKNNMQIITSIINLQIENDKLDMSTANMLLNIQNRIYSMSLIHEKLYMEANLANIDFEDYTKGLVGYLLSNFSKNTTKIIPRIDIDNIYLNVTTGIPCGLIINEIVTNSIKYAFNENEKGEIFVQMHKTEDGFIELKIGNNGKPFDYEVVKNENTIGLKLITLLSKQLRSELEIDNSKGIEYKMKFKVNRKENI